MSDVLQTSRLRLRHVEPRDIPAIVEGRSEPDVARFIPIIPCPYGERLPCLHARRPGRP
jgi:RimJ/RimL family protein N-acetyltransferase